MDWYLYYKVVISVMTEIMPPLLALAALKYLLVPDHTKYLDHMPDIGKAAQWATHHFERNERAQKKAKGQT